MVKKGRKDGGRSGFVEDGAQGGVQGGRVLLPLPTPRALLPLT